MKYLLLICLFQLVSFSTQAIVIRHDVDDLKYRASKDDFPALATFYKDGAHGTLIHPKWIVTAAHASFCISADTFVDINGIARKIKKLQIHPDYQPGKSHDIALVELENPVTDVEPVNIYNQTTELYKQVWFIGIGGTGTGLTGETVDNAKNNGILRKAQNTIIEASGPLIKFIFNREKQALPLEGVSGGGDSGGPAYMVKDGQFELLGISSRPEGQFNKIGVYGITEVYSRTSFFKLWIESVIAGKTMGLSNLPTDKLVAGLTPDLLPMVCEDIKIKP
ncbi:trypsin-like serine protease [Thalassotalea aquiviva]|uniref:trypsin-like serine protease n=1 Tax=Thalassotalea aquiviva TaxID=3242415 RepID=UPI00352A8203